MNRFEYEGKTYAAKAVGLHCHGCAFDYAALCPKIRKIAGSECGHKDREDGRDIIWVEEGDE